MVKNFFVVGKFKQTSLKTILEFQDLLPFKSCLSSTKEISQHSTKWTIASAEFSCSSFFIPCSCRCSRNRMNCRARIWRFITKCFLQPYRSGRGRKPSADPSEKDNFLIQLFRMESFCLCENVVKISGGEINFYDFDRGINVGFRV